MKLRARTLASVWASDLATRTVLNIIVFYGETATPIVNFRGASDSKVEIVWMLTVSVELKACKVIFLWSFEQVWNKSVELWTRKNMALKKPWSFHSKVVSLQVTQTILFTRPRTKTWSFWLKVLKLHVLVLTVFVELKPWNVIFCWALIKFGTKVWSFELANNNPQKTMELSFWRG